MQSNTADRHGLFRVTQGIFLSNTDHRLLLLKLREGKWLLPGGKLNMGEGWLSGLRREVFEETSIDDFSVTGISEVGTWQQEGELYYGVFFIGKTESREIKLSDEHIDYKWVDTIEEVDGLEIWNDALKDRIRRFLKR